MFKPCTNYEFETYSKALEKFQQLSQIKNYLNYVEYEKHEVLAVSALFGFLLSGEIDGPKRSVDNLPRAKRMA